MESPCECGIEPPGSISHRVSLVNYYRVRIKNLKNFEMESRNQSRFESTTFESARNLIIRESTDVTAIS